MTFFDYSRYDFLGLKYILQTFEKPLKRGKAELNKVLSSFIKESCKKYFF